MRVSDGISCPAPDPDLRHPRPLFHTTQNVDARPAKCTRIEMHVIDVREDVLRPWYSKQGYTRTDEAKPFVAPEILAEDYKNVMMVLYTKEL